MWFALYEMRCLWLDGCVGEMCEWEDRKTERTVGIYVVVLAGIIGLDVKGTISNWIYWWLLQL